MSVTAVCTGCEKRFNAPDALAGKKVRCKHCGAAFRVPGGPAEAASAPTTTTTRAAAAAPAKRPTPAAAAPRTAPPAKAVKPAPVDDQGEYGLSDDDLGLPAQDLAPARPY